jgi:hypothetical protein
MGRWAACARHVCAAQHHVRPSTMVHMAMCTCVTPRAAANRASAHCAAAHAMACHWPVSQNCSCHLCTAGHGAAHSCECTRCWEEGLVWHAPRLLPSHGHIRVWQLNSDPKACGCCKQKKADACFYAWRRQCDRNVEDGAAGREPGLQQTRSTQKNAMVLFISPACRGVAQTMQCSRE